MCVCVCVSVGLLRLFTHQLLMCCFSQSESELHKWAELKVDCGKEGILVFADESCSTEADMVKLKVIYIIFCLHAYTYVHTWHFGVFLR